MELEACIFSPSGFFSRENIIVSWVLRLAQVNHLIYNAF